MIALADRLAYAGPPPMINACKKHLEELGFPPTRAVSKADDVSAKLAAR